MTLPEIVSLSVATGLFHAITEARSGAGCVAMLWGSIVPGIRTRPSDELANILKSRSPVHPLMNA